MTLCFDYLSFDYVLDDSNDRQMESQGGEVPQTTQPPPSTTPSILFGQRVPMTVERQTSMNRQLAPFILGVGFQSISNLNSFQTFVLHQVNFWFVVYVNTIKVKFYVFILF